MKVDLPSYSRKNRLKKSYRSWLSNLALKTNLTKLKAEIDKLDVEKLKTASVYWSKLSNVVNHKFVKKTVYDKIVAKINNCDTSGFALKTKRDTDKSNVEKYISDADKMAGDLLINIKTDDNTKITKIEGKIPSFRGLSVNAALTAVKNKKTDVSNSVKKKRIMTQKNQTLNQNILLVLIKINLIKILLLIT